MSDGLYPLPNGWEWRKLPQVVRIGCLKGFIPTIIDGKVPFIGMSDIDEKNGRKSKYILEDFEKVSSGKTKFEKNAILVGKITPCTQNNKISIVPNDIDGGYATTEVFALHCSKTVEPLYLNYFLRDNQINKILVESMVGATGRQRVPTETLANLDIPLPPLDEQKRIVEKLDGLFAKIDKAIALLDESITSASALLPSALNEVFGELSEKFEVVKLDEVVRYSQGIQVPLNEQHEKHEEGLYRFLRIVNYTQDSDDFRFIRQFSEKASVTEDDIVMVRYGATAGFVGKGLSGIIANNMFRVIPTDLYLNDYIYYAITNPSNQQILYDNIGAAAMPAINFGTMSLLTIPLVDKVSQTQTVAHLDAVREKSERLTAKLKTQRDELVALKASLLERAFKGEL